MVAAVNELNRSVGKLYGLLAYGLVLPLWVGGVVWFIWTNAG